MFPIVPIFIIFPIIVMILAFFKKSYYIPLKILIFWAFVFIFVLSETGADFESYRNIYNLVAAGNRFSDIHGENFFLLIMRFFSIMGFSYYVFRVIYLSAALLILLYFANKMTPNLIMSFLFLMLGYILFILSTYRQLMAMACLFGLFYYILYNKNYIKGALCVVLAMLFHISGIIGLAFLFLYILLKLTEIKSTTALKKYFSGKIMFLFLGVAFIFRIFIYFYGYRFFYPFMGYYPETHLFTAGILSRLIILLIVAQQMRRCEFGEKINMLYCFYFLSLLIYFAFPFDLVFTRLTNNARILDIIFIPLIINEVLKRYNLLGQNKTLQAKRNSCIKNTILVALTATGIYWAMYIYQLLEQTGYYPFVHFIFG